MIFPPYQTTCFFIPLVAPCTPLLALANKKLTEEYIKCSSLDEEELIDRLRSLSSIENKELKSLAIVEPLFSQLADLSYKSRIETIEEYLTVLAAKELLPDELFSYESVEHIGKPYLSKAHDEVGDLIFEPTSIEQFAKVLFQTLQPLKVLLQIVLLM